MSTTVENNLWYACKLWWVRSIEYSLPSWNAGTNMVNLRSTSTKTAMHLITPASKTPNPYSFGWVRTKSVVFSCTRAIDSVPTVGYVEPGIRSIVISKFLAVNALPPLAERMVLLQFDNATEFVLTQPNEYGFGALLTGVIKCIAGMRS